MLLSGFFLCPCAMGEPMEVVLGDPGFPSSCLLLGGLAAGSQAADEPKGQRKEELLSTKRSANVERAHSTVASFKNALHLGKLPTIDEQVCQASRFYCSSYPYAGPILDTEDAGAGRGKCRWRKTYGICGRSICSLQVLKP